MGDKERILDYAQKMVAFAIQNHENQCLIHFNSTMALAQEIAEILEGSQGVQGVAIVLKGDRKEASRVEIGCQLKD